MKSSHRWLLARALAAIWRLVPLRGPGRVIQIIVPDCPELDETSIRYRSLRALLRFENPPEAALFLWRHYEPEVEIVIDLSLGPGMTALDVGANCGLLTLAMRGAVGPAGRVISVDPSPLACQRVAQQSAFNGLNNIEIVNAALGSEEGAADYFRGRVGIGALPATDSDLTTAERVPTDVMTTDALVRRLHVEGLALIKIDTDGSECSVLEGAQGTLRDHCPTIVCEFYPDGLRRRGRSPYDQGQLLVKAGYLLLRPRFERRSRLLARPPRLRGFEPIEVADLPHEGAENIVALHPANPHHRRILRQLTTRRTDALARATRSLLRLRRLRSTAPLA